MEEIKELKEELKAAKGRLIWIEGEARSCIKTGHPFSAEALSKAPKLKNERRN
jgi:hypothetical protein